MSETATHVRDATTGRFQLGHTGGGRPRGSRNKLGEQFLSDLRDVWQTHGIQALEKCAEEEPGTFVRVIAGLLPKTIDLNLTLDATSFASKLQQAAALLGHDIDPPRRLRKPLPGQPPLIENGDGR